MKPWLAELLPETVQLLAWPHFAALLYPDWLDVIRALNPVTRFCGLANWVSRLSGTWLTGDPWYAKKRLGGKSAVLMLYITKEHRMIG